MPTAIRNSVLTFALFVAACASLRLEDRTSPASAYRPVANLQGFTAFVTAPEDFEVLGVVLEHRGTMDAMRNVPGDQWAVTVAIPACDEVVAYRYIVRYRRGASGSERTKTFPETATYTRTILDQPADCTDAPTVGRRRFDVDTVDDGVDVAPGDGACATSAGACSLRAAIMETNALEGLNEVALPGGVYRLTLTGEEGEDEADAAVGDLDITGPLVVHGGLGCRLNLAAVYDLPSRFDPSVSGRFEPRPDSEHLPGLVTIDGGGIDRVFDVHASSADGAGVQMKCLNVRGGHLRGASFADELPARGAGIRNRSTLLLEEVVVGGNTMVSNGEGVGLYNAGVLVVRESAIFANRNDDTGAGFGGSSGGGLFNTTGARATLERTLVGHNTSARGGGIWNGAGVVVRRGEPTALPQLTLTNVTVAGNVSNPSGVAADVRTKASIANTGTLQVSWSTIHDQTFSQGAFFGSAGTIAVANSIIAATGSSCRAGTHGFSSLGGNFFTDSSCAGLPSDSVSPRLVFNEGLFWSRGFTPTLELPAPDPSRPSAVDGGVGLVLCPPDDQRGAARVAPCDSGAFERVPGD